MLGCMAAGGAACIVCGVVWGEFQVAAAVACKAGISAMLALCPLYTEELFPSNLQSAVLQACKLVSFPCSSLHRPYITALPCARSLAVLTVLAVGVAC